MIYEIQRFLEDYFADRSLADRDQYAVALANLYDRKRWSSKPYQFLKMMHGMRSVFYRRNGALDRGDFEGRLLKELDRKFKKKSPLRSRPFLAG